MKNIEISYKWTENYDDSKPNNNFGDETTEIVVDDCYTFDDYLTDNGKIYEKDADCEGLYWITDEEGNHTGEAFFIISKTETDRPITD
jgi:hypothetical protein